MKDTTGIATKIGRSLKRHDTTIFTILIVGALSYCILTLATISQRPLDTTIDRGNTNVSVTFNIANTTRIDNTRVNGTNPGEQTIPRGRISPFSE